MEPLIGFELAYEAKVRAFRMRSTVPSGRAALPEDDTTQPYAC